MWLDVDGTGGTLRVPACASHPVAHKTRPPWASPPLPGNEARSDHDSAAVLQSKAEEHAPRALVLHVTPMEDDRVSACDGTATIVLVCRIILRLAHLSSMFRRISLFEHLFSCAGRSLAFASSRLDEYGYSVRSQTSGKVELCDHARSLRTPFTWS